MFQEYCNTKTILGLLAACFLILQFACSSDNKTQPASQLLSGLQSSNPREYLVGKWAICAAGNEKGIIQYNVCPVIIFKKNQVAMVFKGKQYVESLSWRADSNSLHLGHTAFFGTDSIPFFADHSYRLSRTEDSVLVYLTIVAVSSADFYQFTRIKQPSITEYLYD